MASVGVPGFLPSTSGFRFPNRFPHVPVRRIGVPGVLDIPIGDASDGLCGGMAFAARDYFEAGRPPPTDPDPPAEGTPLFDYLVERLFDSFGLPLGPGRYLGLMSPALPDGDPFLARLGLAPHGRAWRTIREEWPRVRAEIDRGRPAPLGLVRVKSWSPIDLKQNHQVLAYGYELDGDRLLIRIYDPNHPGDDGVSLSLDVGDSRRPMRVSSTPPGPPVLAFFLAAFSAAAPPA